MKDIEIIKPSGGRYEHFDHPYQKTRRNSTFGPYTCIMCVFTVGNEMKESINNALNVYEGLKVDAPTYISYHMAKVIADKVKEG